MAFLVSNIRPITYVSSYENIPNLASVHTMTLNAASISHAVAFNLPLPLKCDFLRLPVLMSTGSTTIATVDTSQMNASFALYSTWNAAVYSLGKGAQSKSLFMVGSGSAGWTQSISATVISGVGEGTRLSQTMGLTGYVEGLQTTQTVTNSSAQSNYGFSSDTMQTNWSSLRFLDINFSNTLSSGNYWLIFGYSTSTTGGGTSSVKISAATACRVYYSNHYGNSQATAAFGVMGSTNLTSGGLLGCGSFSTAGGGITTALPISAISSSASNVRPYFQLLRSA